MLHMICPQLRASHPNPPPPLPTAAGAGAEPHHGVVAPRGHVHGRVRHVRPLPAGAQAVRRAAGLVPADAGGRTAAARAAACCLLLLRIPEPDNCSHMPARAGQAGSAHCPCQQALCMLAVAGCDRCTAAQVHTGMRKERTQQRTRAKLAPRLPPCLATVCLIPCSPPPSRCPRRRSSPACWATSRPCS